MISIIIIIIYHSLIPWLTRRYVEIAKLLIENGSKIDFREPTDELYPRTMMSDEPLRLALKNRHYVSHHPVHSNRRGDNSNSKFKSAMFFRQ